LKAVAGGLAGLLAQIQLEVGEAPAKLRQQAREEEGRNGRDDAHPEVAGQGLPRRPDEIGELLGLAQDPPRLLHHPVAQRREAHHAFRPLDQHHADQGLQLPQPRGKGRLGDEARLRRPAEMAVVMQRDEILQLLEGGDVGAHINRFARSIRAN
jgi:hypothetical protein